MNPLWMSPCFRGLMNGEIIITGALSLVLRLAVAGHGSELIRLPFDFLDVRLD